MTNAAAKGRSLLFLAAAFALLVALLAAPAAEATRTLPALAEPAQAPPRATLDVLEDATPKPPTQPEKRLRLFEDLSWPTHPLELVQISKTASGVFDLGLDCNILEKGGLSQVCGSPSFQGLWHDPTTGLAYARNRWYDARTASWLSEDPLGAVDSPNLYAFVGWGAHLLSDPMGLATLLENPNWHHMLPIAIFEKRSKGRPSVITEMGLKLADDVDIHSSEYGRIIDRPEHTGPGSSHRKYSAAFEQELLEWRDENPGRQFLKKADIDQILGELPDEMQEFNRRGTTTRLSYHQWKNKLKKFTEIKRLRTKIANRHSRLGRNRSLKVRAVGWFQVIAGSVSLISDEVQASRLEGELRLRYELSGYSEEEIDRLIYLRKRLEYLATEEVSWPIQFLNPDYDPKIEKYLRELPDGVIIPDEDVSWAEFAIGEGYA